MVSALLGTALKEWCGPYLEDQIFEESNENGRGMENSTHYISVSVLVSKNQKTSSEMRGVDTCQLFIKCCLLYNFEYALSFQRPIITSQWHSDNLF